ncbi:Transaldolase [Pleurostoma richardsiae]|uniref:Transaldolase n=1 Tax=Pleurostoma richardsiae TaxID=41990 RepID=A0AA38S592_9PEZI|nr:Transaldolase [Pleurostoma richardsiae]
MPGRTLLDRLESLCNVDVDDASTDFIKSLQPFTPHNQTSNQAIITGELLKPTNEGLLKDLVKQYGSKGWDEVYDRAAVQICARNVPLISGRVLIQTSLRYANDRDAIIRQCRSYAAAFADAGVPRDRFAIKLPFSGAAASAALVLNAEGIRTLATAVFSLEQAIAASQSNCLFISPYYNEIAAHLDPSLRLVFADPALENPMSARVVHILETYAKAYAATGKEQPIMVIASHFNTAEVLAMAELGCQHVTISAANLVALRETPDSLPPVTRPKPKHPYAELATPERLRVLSTVDPLAGPDWNGVLATMDTDYVADGGAKLDEFLRTDPVAGRRLRDATQFFLQAEDKARQAIEKQIAAAGL